MISHEIADGYLNTKIQDTGIGVTPQNLEKFFTPYFRAENKETVQGTGLGLYIVKKFVDEMGGKIEVSSELNTGTTFTVSLQIPSQNGLLKK